jgi:hypothetical protein
LRGLKRTSASAAQCQRLAQPGGADTAGTDGPHLACQDQIGDGAWRVRQRLVRFVGVRLLEVDVVGLQVLQRRVELGADALGPKARGATARPRRPKGFIGSAGIPCAGRGREGPKASTHCVDPPMTHKVMGSA